MKSRSSTFLLTLKLPIKVELKNQSSLPRDEFLARCAQHGMAHELLGITEGVLLAEEAHERGYETESWVLDAGLAPHERDWVQQEKVATVDLYFSSYQGLSTFKKWLDEEWQGEFYMTEVPDQDWNAEWKKSFQGIEIEAGIKILPPWMKQEMAKQAIWINPGAGFGTGTHETTQLCLKLLRRVKNLDQKTVLDFGSGSGILSIAAAVWGAKNVVGVEIDDLAIENAQENAKLNHVEQKVTWLHELPPCENEQQTFDVLLANILRPILIQYAPEIKKRLKKGATLVLSGLVEMDLPLVLEHYSGYQVQTLEKGEWRALLLTSL